MTHQIAVIQFPGLNSEYETRRALREAGLDAQFVRWNEDPKKLESYDGFVVSGGFSYEDRGRAGLIAAFDPIMQKLREEDRKLKPILGICNGAQVLVESGLVPGGLHHDLLLCLAQNDRGYFYNENFRIRMDAPQGRTAFTLDLEQNSLHLVPIAHGEGRFTTQVPGLWEALQKNQQIVFRYADENPNGAMDNAAAICNGPGNVLAIMPHPERAFTAPIPGIFSSMKRYLEGAPLLGASPVLTFLPPHSNRNEYQADPQMTQLLIELLITDNEAQSIQNLLEQRGYSVKLRCFKHIELPTENFDALQHYNPNKERVFQVSLKDTSFKKEIGANYVLVRDFGKKTGKLWEIQGDCVLEDLLKLNLFSNPNAQELWTW